jgi:cyanate permease
MVHTSTQLEAAGKRSVPVQTAIRQAAFWWLTVGFSCATFVAVSLAVHLIPYLITRGYSTVFAAGVLGLLGGSQLIGRLLFTPLRKYIPERLLTAGLFVMQLLALLILIVIPVQGSVMVFAVLFGSAAGASTLARADLLADMYGAVYFGSISGIQTLVITVTNSLAPVGMGVLYMVTGSYQQVLWTLMIVSVAAVIAMFLIRDEQQTSESHAK